MKLLYKPCQKQQRTKKKLTPKQIINYQKKLLDLMKKRKNLLIKTNRDNIAELNKIISKKQREDIHKYNMEIIKETVEQ